MKLKLTTKNDSRALHFERGTVVIGSGGTHQVDLRLENLKPVHLRLVEQNGQIAIINEANDPFASINGLPFRRKVLHVNDLIECAPEVTLLVEDLGAEPVAPIPTQKATKPIKINDLDDEPEPIKSAPKGKIGGLEQPSFFRSWRMVLTVAGMFVILTAFIIGAIYTKATEQTREEEFAAAEAVSDIAMALMYAQVNHLKPKKHNWSDPDFIKNNLAAVVTHEFPALENLDAHGQFAHTPYILRTYTNSDFSHFIVIAQPVAGVSQWLLPHTAIVIDSTLMELHKIDDLRALNRLLVNPNILEGDQAHQVTDLIANGELVPLSLLAAYRSKQGFIPPKALALLYPGAEDRIYNAPRYYSFGESIVKRSLQSGLGNTTEHSRLHQEMEVMAQLPNMVFYSSQGMEVAMETHRVLSQIFPESKFISGYLKFNHKRQLISSNLILDSDVTMAPLPEPIDTELEVSRIIEDAVMRLEEEIASERKLALQERFKQLLMARKEALYPQYSELKEAFGCCIDTSNPTTIDPLNKQVALFHEEARRQDSKLRDRISSLYYETLPLPFNMFLNALNEAEMLLWLDWLSPHASGDTT